MDVVAIVAALGLAFVLGVSDAPNATAALVASRAAPWHAALLFSFVLHALGALLGGTAVAFTINTLVKLGRDDVPSAYAAASLAAVVFVSVAARTGIPSSATYGVVGGLIGAALVAGGVGSINWGGVHGVHPVGVIGVFVGLAVSPPAGVAGGWLLRAVLASALRRATRRVLGPVRYGVWVSAGLVALSDGTNDGQKAMGIGAGVLVASGSLSSFSIPLWLRVAVALVLALGTAVAGGRVIRRVSSGFYRPGPVDSLAAQVSAATVIFGAVGLGAPISTSEVVAASVIGVGLDRRPRHIRWASVLHTLSAWAVTVPVCVGLGAGFLACARLIG